jgi:hypothetical protein
MTQRLTQSIFDPWPFSCLAGICTAGISVWMLSDGIRLTPDGWEYWEGSISILLGRGYRYYGGAPIEAYPPLFSFYLSVVQGVFSISGRGLVVAVTLLAAATSAVWVAVFNRLARPAIGFSWTRVFLFLFVVQFVAYSYVALLSETIFLLFLGAALLSVVSMGNTASTPTSSNSLWLPLLGLASSACAMVATRNSALAFIPGFALVAALALSRRPTILRVGVGLLMLLVPGSAWYALRSAFGQGGSHASVNPTVANLLKRADELARGVPDLFATEHSALGLGLVVFILAALVSVFFARFDDDAGSTRRKFKFILLIGGAGLCGLIASMLLIHVADPLAGRFIWFIPMTLVVVLSAAATWLGDPRHRTVFQCILLMTAAAQLYRVEAPPIRFATQLGFNESMSIEAVRDAQPRLAHVVPPPYRWIVSRRGFQLPKQAPKPIR